MKKLSQSNRRNFSTFSSLPLIMVLSVFTCSQGHSQEIDTQDSENEEQALNEVVVSGSRVYQVNEFDSASPIQTISSDDLQEFGASTLGDFVRDLSVSSNSNNLNNPYDRGGLNGRQDSSNTSFNLRGLGLDGTVVLIDGQRPRSSSVDVNGLIPDIALDRAEILLDGGSALAGADAVAGIVNLIPVKEYEGFKINTFYTQDDGGDFDESKLSMLAGRKFGDVNVITSLQYNTRSPLSATERPEFLSGADVASASGNPGQFRYGFQNSQEVIDPNCGIPVDGNNVDSGAPGFKPSGEPNSVLSNRCFFYEGEYNDYLTERDNLISRTSLSYDVNDDFNIEFDATFNFRESTERNSIRGSTLNNQRLVIPQVHPAVQSDPILDSIDRPLFPEQWRPFGKVGTLPTGFNEDGSSDVQTDTFTDAYSLKFNYTLFDSNWKGSTFFNYAQTRTDTKRFIVLTDRLQASLRGLGGPNGDQYFNPFYSSILDPSLANSQELVDWLVVEDEWESTKNSIKSFETLVIGDTSSWFSLPSGPVRVALGFNIRDTNLSLDDNQFAYEFNDYSDPIPGPNTFSFPELVRSSFVEFGVPVLDNLNLSLQGRYEDYARQGYSPFIPKIALNYQPTKDLALRASFGENFTAPNGQQLNSDIAFSGPLLTATDPFSVATYGVIPVATGGEFDFAGNSMLDPETSQTRNIGFTYRGIPNLSISMDLQEIETDNRIVRLSSNEVLARQYNDYLLAGGNPEDANAAINYLNANPTPEIVRDPVTGAVEKIIFRPVNAEGTTLRFADARINYRFNSADYGFFNASLEATYFDTFKYVPESSADGTAADAVGNRNRTVSVTGALPEWKANLILSWLRANHSVVVRVNYVDEVAFDGPVTPGAFAPQNISSYTTTDLRYTYRFDDLWGYDAQLAIGSRNIFDQEADALPVGLGFESRLQDPIGRTFYIDFSFEI